MLPSPHSSPSQSLLMLLTSMTLSSQCFTCSISSMTLMKKKHLLCHLLGQIDFLMTSAQFLVRLFFISTNLQLPRISAKSKTLAMNYCGCCYNSLGLSICILILKDFCLFTSSSLLLPAIGLRQNQIRSPPPYLKLELCTRMQLPCDISQLMMMPHITIQFLQALCCWSHHPQIPFCM